ncbi:hypothetical protein LAZ67_7002357 [Cordylochernes scorpioides]|uniref:Reverse transcriptase domain-containing protein n=1 Tax=Cordylochernes scorpioides TaxID=51811 RepID=A0ABY6KN92_9ARAC|nr:hypothetical protein LAZ67_7002357 [Cordylochernes scorpioides]
MTRDIRHQKNDITQRHNSKLHHWIKKYNFPAYLLEAYLPQSPQGVVNLSDYVLASADAEILSLGLKYRLPGPSDIPRIIAGVEPALRGLNHQDTHRIRHFVTSTLQRPYNIPKPSLAMNRVISRLKRNRDIVITKSDKGSQTVILNTTVYKQKMQNVLDQHSIFSAITEQEHKTSVKNFRLLLLRLKRSQQITKEQYNDFTANLAQIAYIYGLPKIHKPDVPLRPIISYHLSPAYTLSKFLSNFLTPLLQSPPWEYTIANSPSFVSYITSLTPSPRSIMVSFDVTSLYLSLAHPLIINSLRTFLENAPLLDTLTAETVVELTSICLGMSTFTFDTQFFKQTKGSPMGSPLSTVVAEVVMRSLDQWITSRHSSDIFLWRRYIDDTFCLNLRRRNLLGSRKPAHTFVDENLLSILSVAIRELQQDGNFQNSLNEVEAAAWNSFRNVCKNFLGSVKVENYRDIVNDLLLSYKALGCNMSFKIHFLHSHLDFFPDNLGAVSDEHEDADYQRILWRPSPEEPVEDYRLLTVTYGTTSAPFLAMRTLQQLAEDEGQNYPEASRVTLNDFYVDDLLTGAQTIAEAKELIDQLKDLMKKGGFHLRKWNSNCHEIVSHVEEINEEKKINLEKGAISKILGIVWDHVQDTFRVNITLPEEVVTKRDLLSNIARIFDPLGFLSPTTVAMANLKRQTAVKEVEDLEGLPVYHRAILKENGEWPEVTKAIQCSYPKVFVGDGTHLYLLIEDVESLDGPNVRSDWVRAVFVHAGKESKYLWKLNLKSKQWTELPTYVKYRDSQYTAVALDLVFILGPADKEHETAEKYLSFFKTRRTNDGEVYWAPENQPTPSWMRNYSPYYLLPGHTTLRKDRPGTFGGGLAVLIKTLEIKFKEISYNQNKPTESTTEAQAIKIYLTDKAIPIINVYHHDNTSINTGLIETLSEASSDIAIILGDFNAEIPTWGSPVQDNKGQQVEEMLTDLDLTPLNNEMDLDRSPQAQNPQ